MCGNLFFKSNWTTKSRNIKIFIWPDILIQGLFAIINRYQEKSAEQMKYQVLWLPLKYRRVYENCRWLSDFDVILIDSILSVTSSAVAMYARLYTFIFMSLIATQRNALYATWMEMLIETALSNATQTVTGSSFDIVSWTLHVYPGQLHYRHYIVAIIDNDLLWLGHCLEWCPSGQETSFCYCEQYPGASIRLCRSFSSVYKDLTTSWKSLCVVSCRIHLLVV